MSYTLSRLGSANFENLVQALTQKILGNGAQIFGAGPDGQREASFEGTASYPGSDEGWSGKWIVQAKYKDENTKTRDFDWLKKVFEEEMKGFQKKKENEKILPNNYLFFTNVVLTGVEDKGVRDKIEKVKSEYANLIPNISIIGHDEIIRYLDDNRDIATSYMSYIASGDVLQLLFDRLTQLNGDNFNALLRYISREFNGDLCTRMEQAGDAENQIGLDRVFVDLKFKSKNGDVEKSVLSYIIESGNRNHSSDIDMKIGEPVITDSLKSSKRFKNERDNFFDIENNIEEVNQSRYLLKGAAGQGKSTLCQFLAQIYRAKFYTNFYESIRNADFQKICEFTKKIESERISIPKVFRIPVRIELKRYSTWLNEREQASKAYGLITYVCERIKEKSESGKFDEDILRGYLKSFSWLIILDGLDEVPETSNRGKVISEINDFIGNDLTESNVDCVILATTRPEGYNDEFSDKAFVQMDLNYLSEEDCKTYVGKLLDCLEKNSDYKEEKQKILFDAIKDEKTAYLMSTPLQVTIMTILVKSGGNIPHSNYALFKGYFNTVINREKQKNIYPDSILNSNTEFVENTYYRLGYELQKKSESEENSAALLSFDELKALIKEYLSVKRKNADTDKVDKDNEEMFRIIVNRINFASEIQTEKIGFSIRAMQEFLAACYLVSNKSDDEIRNTTKLLAASAYWRNAFYFFVEYLLKDGRDYLVDYLIDTVCNGFNIKNSFCETSGSIIFYGSQLAFDLFSNNVFRGNSQYDDKLCELMKKIFDLTTKNIGKLIVDKMEESEYVREKILLIMDELIRERHITETLLYVIFLSCRHFEEIERKYEKMVDDITVDMEAIKSFYNSFIFIRSESANNFEFKITEKLIKIGIEMDFIFYEPAQINKVVDLLDSDLTEDWKKAINAALINYILGRRYPYWSYMRSDGSMSSTQSYRSFKEIGFEISNIVSKTEKVYKKFLSYKNDIEKHEEIIKLFNKIGFTALAKIMECMLYGKVEAYRDFCFKIKEYADEIEKFELYYVFHKNSALNDIWYGYKKSNWDTINDFVASEKFESFFGDKKYNEKEIDLDTFIESLEYPIWQYQECKNGNCEYVINLYDSAVKKYGESNIFHHVNFINFLLSKISWILIGTSQINNDNHQEKISNFFDSILENINENDIKENSTKIIIAKIKRKNLLLKEEIKNRKLFLKAEIKLKKQLLKNKFNAKEYKDYVLNYWTLGSHTLKQALIRLIKEIQNENNDVTEYLSYLEALLETQSEDHIWELENQINWDKIPDKDDYPKVMIAKNIICKSDAKKTAKLIIDNGYFNLFEKLINGKNDAYIETLLINILSLAREKNKTYYADFCEKRIKEILLSKPINA